MTKNCIPDRETKKYEGNKFLNSHGIGQSTFV